MAECDQYLELLFDQKAIWKIDDNNIVLRKCGIRSKTKKPFLANGVVHIVLSPEIRCTCDATNTMNCIHAKAAAKIDLTWVPRAGKIISDVPFVCHVFSDTWGVLCKEGGHLQCVSCKSIGKKNDCAHFIAMKEEKLEPSVKKKY